jgi:hypothetical protein
MNKGERHKLIQTAREVGMSDTEILKEIMRGVHGPTERREMIVEWGVSLGIGASAALLLARAAALIPTTHPPRRKR